MHTREFTCPYCQAELEVESGVERVVCPDCEKEFDVPHSLKLTSHHRPVHPVKRSSGSPILMIIFLIAGAGITGIVWFVYQNYNGEIPVEPPPAKVENPAHDVNAVNTAEMAQIEKDWNALQIKSQRVLAEGGDLDPVLDEVERFSQRASVTYRSRIAGVRSALKTARAEAIAAHLKAVREEAKRVAAAGDLAGAARVCRSYTGEYAAELKKTLADLAGRYEASDREIQRGYDIVVAKAARRIVHEQPAQALVEIADFEYQKMLMEVTQLIKGLTTAKEEILASFRKQAGAIGPVQLNGKEVTVRIGGVGDDTVELQRKVGTQIAKKLVALDEFDLAELDKRLVETGAGAKALYLGCMALKKNDRDAARAWYGKVPELGEALVAELNNLPALMPDPVFATDPLVTVPPPVLPEAADPAPSIDPHYLVLKGIVRRQTRKESEYSSSKTQKLVARVFVKNNSTEPVPGLKTEIFIIGQDAGTKNVLKVLKRIDATLDVGKWTSAETEDTEISVQFYDSYYGEYGYPYYGWVAALRDSKGNLLKTSFYRSKLGKIVNQIVEMNEGQTFNLDGE